MKKVKTLSDYGFQANLSRTSKEDVFYFLTKIYNDRSQRLFVESIFSKMFPEIYQDFQSNLDLFPKEFSFSQKMYHFLQSDLEFKIGVCKMCSNRCTYINMKNGYRTYCCKKCVDSDYDTIQEKCKQTCLERYGCEFTFQTENNKTKSRKTKLERYGDETFTNTEKGKETKIERYGSTSYNNYNKYKETCLKLYGVENYSQTEKSRKYMSEYMLNRTNDEKNESITKSKKTKLEKYGNENYNNIEKMKQTCLEKYGVEYYVQTKEHKDNYRANILNRTSDEWNNIISKTKQTKLKRYGTENYNNREHYKQTCLEKYGVNHYSQTEEFNEKINKTSNEKYGTDYPQQSEEIKNKIFNTIIEKYGGIGFASEELNNKVKDSVNKKFGCPIYSQSDDFKNRQQEIINKQHQTKRERGTFHSTKLEDEISLRLDDMNISFKTQYKSPEYPFLCDFYLPNYDLYIEIQGYWCHGNHPFNCDDKNDLELLEFWKGKSKEHNQYNQAINIWTENDPLKRKTAKDNNLNYLEIFSNNIDECISIIENKIKELE